jgi:hypothetical protein
MWIEDQLMDVIINMYFFSHLLQKKSIIFL